MPLLKDAIQAVQRNLPALFLYLAVGVAVTCFGVGWRALTEWDAFHAHPAAEKWASFGVDLALTGWLAAIQCLVFTRLGRSIDNPLWNVRDDRVALDRFFWLWFVFGIASVAALYLADFMAESRDSVGGATVFFMIYVGVLVLSVPVGAAIMFQGVTDNIRLGEALAPLGRQFPATMIVCLITLVPVALFMQVGLTRDHLLAQFAGLTLVNVVAVYVDCVAFAAVFVLCIVDRDTSEERDLDL
ncbi:MAG: hypothetical protein GY851_00615 [bacterium]|nr:hypothetical protein [bacterium]